MNKSLFPTLFQIKGAYEEYSAGSELFKGLTPPQANVYRF